VATAYGSESSKLVLGSPETLESKPVEEVIDHHDGGAGLVQNPGHVGADVAGTTCD